MLASDVFDARGEDIRPAQHFCCRLATSLCMLLTLWIALTSFAEQPTRQQSSNNAKINVGLMSYQRKGREFLLTPDAFSVDVVYIHPKLPRGLWVRGTSGSSPVPHGPLMVSAPLGFGLAGQVHNSDDDDDSSSGLDSTYLPPPSYLQGVKTVHSLRQLVSPHTPWLLTLETSWGGEAKVSTAIPQITSVPSSPANLHAQNDQANKNTTVGSPLVVSVYRDTRLFRHQQIPGCSIAAGAQQCYVALLRLPLSHCSAHFAVAVGKAAGFTQTSSVTSGDMIDESNSFSMQLSWTCKGLLPVDIAQSVSTWDESEGEYFSKSYGSGSEGPGCIRLVSASSLSAVGEYAEAALRQPLLLRTRHAGVLQQFCGNPMQQLIALDYSRGRIFFLQQNESVRNYRRLSQRFGNGPLLNDKKSGFRKAYGLGNKYRRRLSSFGLNLIKYPCAAFVSIDPMHQDVSVCQQIDFKPYDDLHVPVYIHYDDTADVLASVSFHSDGYLVLATYDPTTFKHRASIRFDRFSSGRILSSDFTTPGRLLVSGDSVPFKDILIAVDLSRATHETLLLRRGNP